MGSPSKINLSICLISCAGIIIIASGYAEFDSSNIILFRRELIYESGSISLPQIDFFLRGKSENEILALSQSAVWRFDLSNNLSNVSLVSGSPTEKGYQDGNRGQSRFKGLVGAVYFNTTHILVTDTWNSCVRTVEIDTGCTSTYVGRSLDEDCTTALQFCRPQGIIRASTRFIVADLGANALGLIEGGMLTAFLKHDRIVVPRFLAYIDQLLYCSVSHAIIKINLTSPLAIEVVAGNVSGSEDENSCTRLCYPQMSSINGNLLVINDLGAELLLVDLTAQKGFKICDVDENDNGTCDFTVQYSALLFLPWKNYILLSGLEDRRQRLYELCAPFEKAEEHHKYQRYKVLAIALVIVLVLVILTTIVIVSKLVQIYRSAEIFPRHRQTNMTKDHTTKSTFNRRFTVPIRSSCNNKVESRRPVHIYQMKQQFPGVCGLDEDDYIKPDDIHLKMSKTGTEWNNPYYC